MRVYVDTSALLALLNRADDHHGAVARAVAELEASGASLVTTSYALVETGALVRRRLGAPAFRALGEVASTAFEIVWVDEELHHRAWAAAAQGTRSGPSLVDQAGFLAMRSMGITTALAVDRHFAGAGFDVLPPQGGSRRP